MFSSVLYTYSLHVFMCSLHVKVVCFHVYFDEQNGLLKGLLFLGQSILHERGMEEERDRKRDRGTVNKNCAPFNVRLCLSS